MEFLLNSPYHQAHYGHIGHKVIRRMSDLLSSESSCSENSPEYPQMSVFEHAQYSNGNRFIQNQMTDTTHSSSDDDSSDTEESVVDTTKNTDINNQGDSDDELENSSRTEVCEVNIDDMQINGSNSDDNSLIEGRDYDIVLVYTVDPYSEVDLDDYSNDKDTSVKNNNRTNDSNLNDPENFSLMCQEGKDVSSQCISNVNEYFVKENNKKQSKLNFDEPYVKSVNANILKDKDEMILNPDNSFLQHKLSEKENTQFDPPKLTASVAQIFGTDKNKHTQIEDEQKRDLEIYTNDVSINESKLTKIDEIKRYLLEDIPYTNTLHNNQKSCSVHPTPVQTFCCKDLDDIERCVSLDTIDMVLSDLNFDNDACCKSESLNKSGDIPRTLINDDVIHDPTTNSTDIQYQQQDEHDFSHQDMEIESTISSYQTIIKVPSMRITSTPIPNILDYGVEKMTVKKEKTSKLKEPNTELEDVVDVVSCNNTVIPVLEADNVNSLLEQFEEMEKLNCKNLSYPVATIEDTTLKSHNRNKACRTNGMQLQKERPQLNNNEIQKILVPTSANSITLKTEENIKGEQNLLKSEVLSDNIRISKSRYRTCKNKQIVYDFSSDEEEDSYAKKKRRKISNDLVDVDYIEKPCLNLSRKLPVQSNYHKKSSPHNIAPDGFENNKKANSSAIIKGACKASENSGQNSSYSLKLTIKNKSKIILKSDHIDAQTDNMEKCKYIERNGMKITDKMDKYMKQFDKIKTKVTSSAEPVVLNQKPTPTNENKQKSNKQDHIDSLKEKSRKKSKYSDSNIIKVTDKINRNIKELDMNRLKSISSVETVVVNKNLQPRKENFHTNLTRHTDHRDSRKDKNSKKATNHSNEIKNTDKKDKYTKQLDINKIEVINSADTVDVNKKLRQGNEKVCTTPGLMATSDKKSFDDELNKCDEALLKTKKQPLKKKKLSPQKDKFKRNFCSGNSSKKGTPDAIFTVKQNTGLDKEVNCLSLRPPHNGSINTTNKEYNHQIIFDPIKEASKKIFIKSIKQKAEAIKKAEAIRKKEEDILMSKIPKVQNLQLQPLISDEELMKIVRPTQPEVTTVSKEKPQYLQYCGEIIVGSTGVNSQDLITKPKEVYTQKAIIKKSHKHILTKYDDRKNNPKAPIDKPDIRHVKTKIIKEKTPKPVQGEDKANLHLDKHRIIPTSSAIHAQIESIRKSAHLSASYPVMESPVNRKRNDSDMSLSSNGSPAHRKETEQTKVRKYNENIIKPKEVRPEKSKRKTIEKQSRSKDRYESKYRRRSRSASRSLRRRSQSRNRLRSHEGYQKYRRSDPLYKKEQRSPGRSYPRKKSPSVRHDRPKISRRSRSPPRPVRPAASSNTFLTKVTPSLPVNCIEKKAPKLLTPFLRKRTVSECSDSSLSSSSSSSTSSSSSSSTSSSSSNGSSSSSSSSSGSSTNSQRLCSSLSR